VQGTRSANSHHAASVTFSRLWIYGGGFKPDVDVVGGGILTFNNEIHVLDLLTRKWINVGIHGSRPRPSWSSSLVQHDGRAYLFGGCTEDSYMDLLYQLRFDDKIEPANVYITGPGVESNVTAGSPTYFLLQTREFIPAETPSGRDLASARSVTHGKAKGRQAISHGMAKNKQAIVHGAPMRKESTSAGMWGPILPRGTKQNFVVQLINEYRGLTRATVTELGDGVYNVSYTLGRDYAFKLYIQMILLDVATPILGSPFSIFSTAQGPAGKFVDLVATPAIKGDLAVLKMKLQDALGNYLRTGSDIIGARDAAGQVSASASMVEFDDPLARALDARLRPAPYGRGHRDLGQWRRIIRDHVTRHAPRAD
jgi:hypothetical protein